MIRCITYGRKSSQYSSLVNRSYRQYIISISRRSDLFPGTRTGVAGTAYQYHSFICNMGSLARHQCMTSIQISIFIILRFIIKWVVSQRCIDYIHSHTIGKFNRSRPIILFYQVFRIFILTTKQPKRSFGSRPRHYIRSVHTYTGQYTHPMAAFCKDISLLVYKILCTENTDILHSSNLIDIMESGINNRNCHTLPFEARFV